MVAHIKDLLKLHDCVIIPGLGGLIGHYEPARRNIASGTMAPPMKRVAFNQVLSQNDGLLIHRVATEESISWEEAKEAVQSFRKAVENALQNQGSYLFAGIGKLTYNDDQKLQFHPILKENLLLDTFGMPLIVAQPIQRIKESVETKEVVEIGTATKEVDVIQSADSETAIIGEIPEYRPWIFRAAAFIGLAFLLTTASLNLINTGVSSDQLTLFPSGADPVSLIAGSATTVLDQPVEEQFHLYEAAIKVEAIIETVESTTDDGQLSARDPYFVIVGSFLDATRLQREISNMKQKGFSVQTIPGPNGYTRVALVFDGSTDARSSTLSSVRDTVNADAWMING